MKLKLDVLDLKLEFQEKTPVKDMRWAESYPPESRTGNFISSTIQLRETAFEHLNEAAQKAVIAVGEARFYDAYYKNCVMIHPPSG